MALNNNKEIYLKRIKRFSLYVLLLSLLLYNLLNFLTYISANSELVTNYQTPTDKIKEFRNPLLVASFTDSQQILKILILPHNLPDIKYVQKAKEFNLKDKKINVLQNEYVSKKHMRYLQKYFSDVAVADTLQLDKNAVFVWFDDLEKPLPYFEQIKLFAKTNNLYPKVSDWLQFNKIKEVSTDNEHKISSTLDEQESSLKQFISDYNLELKSLITTGKVNYENIYHMNDKASSLVIACNENDDCEEFVDFSFEKSVEASVLQTLSQANEKYPSWRKKVCLLTQLKRQQFTSEKEFLDNLDNSKGVVMKKGLLTGIMAPAYWNDDMSKQDFVKKLKIKSGINPDYWSNDIQIYFFKAVEIF